MTATSTTTEVAAFLEAAATVPGTAMSACPGWTAHDLLAHVVAGGAEMLLTDHLAGRPPTATIGFADREPPVRALAYDDLLAFLAGGGLLESVEAWAGRDVPGRVRFTGWEMEAASFALHVRSELALHRWDLAGSDEVGRALLAAPELTEHAVQALSRFDAIAERADLRLWAFAATRHRKVEVPLRVDGTPDVVIRVGSGATTIGFAEPTARAAIRTDAAGRLLLLWGRRPPPVHGTVVELDAEASAAAGAWLGPR